MNRLTTLINSTLIILGIAFFVLIVYVSILGDNHKIDFLVTQFFEDLKNHEYARLCQVITPGQTDEALSCEDTCFLLELAFLSRFDLMDKNDYSVEVKRETFWVPFLGKDRISLSVAFTNKKNNMFEQFVQTTDDADFIDDFMQVERSDGRWRIAEVRLTSSSLFSTFSQLKNTVPLDRYVETSDHVYQLKANTVDPATLTSLEKRILRFNLDKLAGTDLKDKNTTP